MIITCPSCYTKYNIDQGKLASKNNKVRCSKCGYSWVVEFEAQNISMKNSEEANQNNIRIDYSKLGNISGNYEPEMLPVVVEAQTPIWATVMPFVFAFLIAMTLMIIARDTWVNKYSNLHKIYDTINMPSTEGLELDKVVVNFKDQTASVSGYIKNVLNIKRSSPNVKLILSDDKGKTISTEIIHTIDKSIPSGGSSSFYFKLEFIPKNAIHLTLVVTNKI
jgi:predicted Zn finger-like uncharacterized protein